MLALNYLHRLPRAISAEQRILFEAIGVAVDLVGIAFDAMHALGAKVLGRRVGEHVEFEHHERLRMMASAWSIVDQAHNTRSLIRAAGKHIDLASARDFAGLASVASRLRDKHDHLNAGTIKNHARNKTPMPPVFGAISFYTFFDSDVDQAASSPDGVKFHSFRVVTVLTSAVQGPFRAEAGPAQNVTRIALPCDHFCLQTFGMTLNLSKIRDAALVFRDDLSAQVEKNCREQVEVIAGRDGIPVEEMLAPVMEATTLVLRAEFPKGS